MSFRNRSHGVRLRAICAVGVLAAACGATLLFGSVLAAAASHPFLGTFGAAAQPSFTEAEGMAVDQASGDLLVIDVAAQTLTRWKPDGEPDPFTALGTNVIDGRLGAGAKPCAEEPSSCDQTPQNGFAFPTGSTSAKEVQVAVAPAGSAGGTAGDVYVTQPANHLIDVFASTGEYLGQLTEYSGGALGEACGVAVDPTGAVYVGDFQNGVHKYVPSANPPRNADNTANFTALANPCTLAAGAGSTAGAVFVDRYNGELFKLDSTSGESAYKLPGAAHHTVSVDPATGHVYSANGNEAAEYDASGASGATFVSSIEPGSEVFGVAVNETLGDVYVSRSGSSHVEVYGPLVAEFPLGVTKSGTGSGTVTSSPAGIDCGSTCSAEFEAGKVVTLTATPTPGSTFAGWSAAGCSGTGSCQVTMSEAQSVGAAFAQAPPTVLTEAGATAIGQAAATVHGTVNPNSGDVTACKVEYGTTTAYGSEQACDSLPGAGSSPVGVAASLVGLSADTTYHFRFLATNTGGTEHGPDQEFTTLPDPPTVITTAGVTAITANGAEVAGTVNPNSGDVTECKFEYGTTSSYGSQVGCVSPPGSGSAAVAVSASLGGLAPTTTYHFRLVAGNAGGTEHGADQTFETSAGPPGVDSQFVLSETATTATIGGQVDPHGIATSCLVEYGADASYGRTAPCEGTPGAGGADVPVRAKLSGLAAGAVYHFRLVATNAAGRAEGPDAVFATYGLVPGSFVAGSFQGDGTGIFGAGATPDTRAGGHPFQATTSFVLNSHTVTGHPPLTPGEISFTAPNGGATRDVVVKLPPGFIGDPFATPQCRQAELVQLGYCPDDTAIGVARLRFVVRLGGGPAEEEREYYLPVYNMVPSRGEPALFAFHVFDLAQPVLIHLHLDPGRGYAVTASVTDISGVGSPFLSELTVWGVPADPSHDRDRGFAGIGGIEPSLPGCIVENAALFSGGRSGKSCPSDAPLRPLLTDPTACLGNPLLTHLSVDSWAEAGRRDAEGEPDLSDPAWSSAEAASPASTGCAALKFGGGEAPVSLTLQPASHAADTPSAYEVKLDLPYNENPGARANPTLRDTTVTLPEGVVVNPSSANGLAACTSAQIGLTSAIGASPVRFDGSPARCPDASKIGTLEVHSPLVDHPLQGSVYLARQGDNPFGSMLALYLVIEDPQTGIIVKLAGKVSTDPQTGRITSTFEENPQLPFTELDLRFFGGPGASLVNPLTCGTKTTTGAFTPWSAPYTPAVNITDSFQIESGANGGSCVSTESQAPTAPTFSAGTVSPQAGAYSPFVLHLRREDGTQRLKGLDVTLPPGLTGKLAGIPYCPESDIARAEGREGKAGQGAVEQANPSCPGASQIGTVDVAAGAGPQPFHVQGNVYLAGPYKGAPLSMVIVTPAIAGPFDLGTVVVRSALYVNPETAQIHAVSDPIPNVLEVEGDGFPLDVRSIALSLDRPDFTLNPTNCAEMAFTGSALTVPGQSSPLAARFQALGCKGLAFAPQLKLQLKGATKRVGHPALKAVVTYPKGGEYANIARAQVNLPHGEFLDQGNLNKTCTRPVLLAGNCPASSVYGKVRAWTPLLEKPLEGPVYLVGGYGYKLPALVAELNGQIRVLLVGKVDSGKNKGIRNTFEVVPDAPVSRFVLEMKGGKKYGLLENSENLCKASKAARRAIVRFVGHNGAVEALKPTVQNECKPGAKKKRAKQKVKR